MEHEANLNFEFSPEQIEAFQKIGEAITKTYDAILEMVRVVIDLLQKAFEPIARMLAMLQLLEWRLPSWMAKLIARKMPTWLAYDIGFRWFHRKTQDLE